MSSIIASLPRSNQFNTDEIAVHNIALKLIEPDKNQVRAEFDEEKLLELSDSIKARGLLNPIHVRNIGEKYVIITGERRYRASKIAGLSEIPCIVHSEELAEKDIRSLQLIENLQRQDLSAIETAKAFQDLIQDGMKQRQIAVELGISESTVSRSLAIFSRLPAEWLSNIEKHYNNASLVELYTIAKEKNKKKKEAIYQKMMEQAGHKVEWEELPEKKKKEIVTEFTDEQLDEAWETLKRKVRRDKKAITKYLPKRKIQLLLGKGSQEEGGSQEGELS